MAAGGLIIDPDALSYTLKRTTTNLAWAANAVTVTSAGHGYSHNDRVHVGGVDVEAYDGTYNVTVNTATAVAGELTWAANVATCAHTAHGFTNGDVIVVSGVTPTDYNGTYTIASADANTFTYALTGTGIATSSGASGTIKWANIFTYPLTGDPGADSTPGYTFWGDRELLVDQVSKKMKLMRVGNMTADGVTLKCLYSKLKELWKTDATLIKYPFPMVPITDEQFEFVSGWEIDKKFASTTEIVVASCVGAYAALTTPYASWTSSVITFTATAHGLLAGYTVTVAGVSPSTYNGSYTVITVPDANTITVTKTTDPGAYTSGGTLASNTVSSSNNFDTAGVLVGMYVGYNVTGLPANTGGTSGQEGAKITAVSGTTVTMDLPVTADLAATLKFWSKNDHTYNLIRTGGWSLKTEAGATAEEWVNYITLGNLGSQGTTLTLTGCNTTVSNTTVVCTSTSGMVAGSYVTGPNLFEGSIVSSITNSTDFVISRAAKASASGGIMTVRPKDQVYYQVGSATSSAKVFALTGAANQAIRMYGDSTHGNFDYRPSNQVTKVFVREQGYTYAVATKQQIGVTVPTYKSYAFPLSNQADLKITHIDTQIDANADNTADVAPYTTMNITWYGAAQSRTIGGVSREFNVVIDADTGLAPGQSGTATAAQIYEFVQWSLRRASDIDFGAGTKTGNITRDLLKFVGDTLYTLYDTDGGVYIDNFNTGDVNNIVFADNTGTNRTYPYTAAGLIQPNAYLVTDGAGSNAIYRAFFKQLAAGVKYGSSLAVLVKKADNVTEMAGVVSGSSIAFDFDYDGNTQAIWAATTNYLTNDEFRYGTSWYKVNNQVTTGDTHTNTTVDAIASTAAMYVGQPISGSGIPTGATIVSIDSGVAITISAAATSSLTGTSLTFSGYKSAGTFGATDTANTTVSTGPTIIITALGLSTAQAVTTEGSIARSTSNTYSLVAALERNYANPV